MTQTTIPSTKIYRTWISTPAKGDRHLWPGVNVGTTIESRSNWIAAQYIVPKTFQILPSARGAATFEIHYTNSITYSTSDIANLVAGQYICICEADTVENATPANYQTIKWFGTITNMSKSPEMGQINFTGSLFAERLGHRFDKTPLFGFKDVSGRILENPPTMNYKQGMGYVGNYTQDGGAGNGGTALLKGNFTIDRNKLVTAKYTTNKYVWPSDESEITDNPAQGAWTRIRALYHIIEKCLPPDFPIIDLTIENKIVKILNDPKPEIFNFKDATFGSALDILVSLSRGIVWDLIYKGTAYMEIVAYTTSSVDIKSIDGTTVFIPANTAADLELKPLIPIAYERLSQDTKDRVDRIVVQGNPIVCCGTIRGPGFNSTTYSFMADWGKGVLTGPIPPNNTFSSESFHDPLEELKYDADPALSENEYIYMVADGYAADSENNDVLRSQSWLENVFTKFKLRTLQKDGVTDDGVIRIVTDPLSFDTSLVANQDLIAFCPKFTWDAAAAQAGKPTVNYDLEASPKNHSTPALGKVKILDWIPWQKGITFDYRGKTVDARDQKDKASMEFCDPYFYNYKDGLWIDLKNIPKIGKASPPTVTPTFDDSIGNIFIKMKPAMVLAKDEFAIYDAVKINDVPINGKTSFNPLISKYGMTWRNMMITIAIESDQHIRVEKLNPRLSDAGVTRYGRTLLVTAPLDCHFIHRNTLIGFNHEDKTLVSSDSRLLPNELTVDTFTKNDYAQADRICSEIAAWAFRTVDEVKVTLPLLDNLSQEWMHIGHMIGTVQDESPSGDAIIPYAVNTPIMSIEVSCIEENPTVTFATTRPPMPDLGGALIMSGDGSTSAPSIGGTLLQATQQSQRDIVELKNRKRATPEATYPGEEPSSTVRFGTVVGGNSTPITTPDIADFETWTYPSKRAYVFALANSESPVSPTDWADLELPQDFEHGDTITTASPLPPGVGYVRLLKGSASFGTSSWDADQATFGNEEDDPAAIDVTLVKAQVRNKNQLWLYFSEKITWTAKYNAIPLSTQVSVSFSNTDEDGNNTLANCTVSTFIGVSDNIAKFTLSRNISSKEVGQMSGLFAGIVKDAQQHENKNTISANAYNIVFASARNCYVLVTNRYCQKTLSEGEEVDLYDSGFTLDDKQSTPVSKSLLDMMPRSANQYMPHRHLSESAGISGGGIAFSGFLPTTAGGLQALGLTDLIRTTTTL